MHAQRKKVRESGVLVFMYASVICYITGNANVQDYIQVKYLVMWSAVQQIISPCLAENILQDTTGENNVNVSKISATTLIQNIQPNATVLKNNQVLNSRYLTKFSS